MSPIPFRHQPSFRAVIFAIVLAAAWLYSLAFQDGWLASLAAIGLDLILLFLLLQACLFFYAQFILPVRTLQDRLRILDRMLLHARNAHGPAVFVQNGRRVERRGESSKSGPCLLWIDTASAAMTRSESGPKQVLGPGIHFLGSRERIDAAFDLHTQTYSIGPGRNDPVFDKLPEDPSEDDRRRHALMQAKRRMVSGLTRDGNEVVPEIRVVFRLDGRPAQPGRPGSRFGFLPDSIERAARGEGVNVDPVSARRFHVAWNQLPGLIAVDLWREYLAKFTLDELFGARLAAVPDVLQPEEPVPTSAFVASPMVVRRTWPARLLWRFNNSLERWLQAKGVAEDEAAASVYAHRPPVEVRQVAGREYTALQIIAHMVKARMMQAAVPILDECGRCVKGHVLSEEYKRLRERGLRILDVTLGGYRFDPGVEEQIVQQWRSAWFADATGERGHVEQLEVLAAESGRQKALLEHASVLGRALRTEPAASIPAVLRVLLQASHNEMLTNERLHGQGRPELDSLSELSKWVESPANE
ncbi:MAG: hypothetical protein V1755_01380 [Chloroflexota bacterium]